MLENAAVRTKVPSWEPVQETHPPHRVPPSTLHLALHGAASDTVVRGTNRATSSLE